MTVYDVGIVGLGAMGSMAARELVRRGRRVIGFDRFHPPHQFGSSHGKTRIIREAYFEHPQYVPFVQRAYELWPVLERESGTHLLDRTGGLMVGPPGGTLVSGARRSAVEHRLAYEELSAADVCSRFPVFRPGPDEVGLFEPRAGVLRPEAAIEAALSLASRAGAELHFDEPVEQWQPGDPLTVTTARGSYQVRRLILAAGAWTGVGLTGLKLPLAVTRQPLYWFAPSGPVADVAPGRMPIFIWEWSAGRYFYGFPDQGDGVKVAIHHEGERVTPNTVNRSVQPGEEALLREIMAPRTPALNGTIRESAVCLYTNTPDEDFIVDRLPGEPHVVVASPCSGHGFKFSPAIGEVLADLVDGREPAFDLSPFRVTRFR